jgi:hypothetical protein
MRDAIRQMQQRDSAVRVRAFAAIADDVAMEVEEAHGFCMDWNSPTTRYAFLDCRSHSSSFRRERGTSSLRNGITFLIACPRA